MRYSDITELAKAFETDLKEQEKAPNTIKAYLTDIAMSIVPQRFFRIATVHIQSDILYNKTVFYHTDLF